MLTLNELYKRIGSQLKIAPSSGNSEVVVKINNKGIGPMNVVRISYASLGIDWDRGKYILYPEINLEEES